MAEVVNSLFGVTPESLMARREADLQAQAMQYAQMDPFQRASAGIYAGANKLGGALGGMLGAQDPEMQRITQRQSLLQQGQPQNAAGWKALAQQLYASGDTPGAQEAMAKAQSVEATALATKKVQSEIEKNQAAAVKDLRVPTPTDARTPQEKNAATFALTKGGPNSAEYKAAFSDKFLELITPEGAKPTKAGVATDGTQRAVYSDGKTQFVFGNDAEGKLVKVPYAGGISQLTAKTTVNAGGEAESEYSKTLGKGLGAQDLSLKEVAEAAPAALEKVTLTRDLLDSGKILTGAGAGVQLNLLALGQALGATGSTADEVVANTQQLQQLRSQAVLNQIKTSGLGAGQGFTDKDLAFLQDASAGRITLSAETLRRQLDLEEKAFKASANKWNSRIKKLNPKLAESMGLQPVPLDEPLKPSAASSQNNDPLGIRSPK